MATRVRPRLAPLTAADPPTAPSGPAPLDEPLTGTGGLRPATAHADPVVRPWSTSPPTTLIDEPVVLLSAVVRPAWASPNDPGRGSTSTSTAAAESQERPLPRFPFVSRLCRLPCRPSGEPRPRPGRTSLRGVSLPTGPAVHAGRTYLVAGLTGGGTESITFCTRAKVRTARQGGLAEPRSILTDGQAQRRRYRIRYRIRHENRENLAKIGRLYTPAHKEGPM